MRGFLAVARREIAEKRFFFLAAAMASLVPLAVPLVRGLHGTAAAEARDWLALFLATTFAAGLAVGLGSTVLASDLAERRLGFYFSRPITGVALWAGKLGAACLIALGAAAIVYAPTLAANGGRAVPVDLPRQLPVTFAAAVSVLVFLMHSGNIAMRPRSPLLALDLGALVLLTSGAVFALQRLTAAFAMEALARATTFLALVATIAVVTAGLAAVSLGRTDARRAHRTLSILLWGTLGAGITALAGYTQWVLSASPRDIAWIHQVSPASKGAWVVVAGEARGGLPVFLFDTATGRSRRVGADWRWPVLSADGAHAAWVEAPGPRAPFEVVTWKLAEPPEEPVRTTILLSGFPAAAFLSANGGRLGVIAGGVLSAYDLASGASLGSARLPSRLGYPRGFFVADDRIRVFQPDRPGAAAGRRYDILEFDVAARSLTTTGAVEETDWIVFSPSSPDRLLTRAAAGYTLRDGASGATRADLSRPGLAAGHWARFLSDGRIALGIGQGASAGVEIFSAAGKPERTVPFPGRQRIRFGGEAAPGKLVVAVGPDSAARGSPSIFLLDADSGQARPVAEGLSPVVLLAGYLSDQPTDLPAPGSEGTKLFYGPDRSLVRFDPLTGERRVLIGRAADR